MTCWSRCKRHGSKVKYTFGSCCSLRCVTLRISRVLSVGGSDGSAESRRPSHDVCSFDAALSQRGHKFANRFAFAFVVQSQDSVYILLGCVLRLYPPDDTTTSPPALQLYRASIHPAPFRLLLRPRPASSLKCVCLHCITCSSPWYHSSAQWWLLVRSVQPNLE